MLQVAVRYRCLILPTVTPVHVHHHRSGFTVLDYVCPTDRATLYRIYTFTCHAPPLRLRSDVTFRTHTRLLHVPHDVIHYVDCGLLLPLIPRDLRCLIFAIDAAFTRSFIPTAVRCVHHRTHLPALRFLRCIRHVCSTVTMIRLHTFRYCYTGLHHYIPCLSPPRSAYVVVVTTPLR